MNASEKLLADFETAFGVVDQAFMPRGKCSRCGKFAPDNDLYSFDWNAPEVKQYCGDCMSWPAKKESE